MLDDMRDKSLGWRRLSGGPRQIGLALGQAGRDAVMRELIGHPMWQAVAAPAYAEQVARMAEVTRVRFPAIWAEIEGLAEGLDLPLEKVFAWNCRGDLLASVPDGCTTVMVPGETPLLAHNEDGLPFFRGDCFIAEAKPDGQPGFHAFCYPGSIPGHTFAFTEAGLVQTVNNLRLVGVEPQAPRMVLGRAVLTTATLDAALDILREAPSGGFHFSLMHKDDRRILSVEFGGGESSVREVHVPEVHANHALHLPRGLAGQIVTDSSRDRQAWGNKLVAEGQDPLTILRDTGCPGLPIRRDAADDPDEENTLGTAVLCLTAAGLEWSIHDQADGTARYTGTA